MYTGVTFNNLRKALYYIYFGEDVGELEAYKYIIPRQQNFFIPIEPTGNDTFIQFFIDKDERLTQDTFRYKENAVRKVAHCSLRFVGKNAEVWAKAFHHLTKRSDVYAVFLGTCQAQLLEYVEEIYPTVVTFKGVNTHIAFDIMFRLDYSETMELDWLPLEKVSLASGRIE